MKEIKIENWKMYSDDIDPPTYLHFWKLEDECAILLEDGTKMISFYLTKEEAKKLFTDLLKLIDDSQEVKDVK